MSRMIATLASAGMLLGVLNIASWAAPLTGSGVLPFPGATGDPPRDNYLATGTGPGPFTGTWPGAGPNTPPQTPWWGTFDASGPMPHTPPSGPNTTGTTWYNFTVPTFPNGVLPVGTYFVFGDLDNGSSSAEQYQLRAFGPSGQLLTPWLDEPFAASANATAADMPSYSFSGGVYTFDGSTVPGNPVVAVYLQNNSVITRMEVTRSSTFTSFILAAPPIPEPGCGALVGCGAGACLMLRPRTGRTTRRLMQQS
ncbi:MAG TPA: hypothetical protein VNL70_07355 [Tepidisphaeraceae bacterium]|nr:hypothetical protein [Tepidisphaeraceae bacterium]